MSQLSIKYRATKNDFYKLLQTDVAAYLQTKTNRQYADSFMLLKIFFCLALYGVAYSQFINSSYNYLQWLGWCLVFGFCNMLLGVNIAHDAIHHALFRKKWMNKIAGLNFDLIGISSYTWKLKHNYIHHHYPNVIDVDTDIEAGPLLRFSPADKKRWFHRYQHLYAPLIYVLFSLHLVFINDMLLLPRLHRLRSNHPRKKVEWIYLLILLQKLVYIFFTLALPVYLLPFPWWQVVAGFLLMHFTLSLFLALVLLPSHLFEQTTFSTPTAAGDLEEDWTVHQLSTTLDFAAQNGLVHFLFGGFNTNVVHHLFPGVCHCHYKQLSTFVAQRAAELNLPYYHLTLSGAIASHFKTLKKLGSAG
jgi:linoleoyl-CoA desaturase